MGFRPVCFHSKGIVNTKEQVEQLVFCSAVIKESLRLRPSSTYLALYAKVCVVSAARASMLLVP